MDACSSLILLPVGPGTNLDFLLDTLDSVYRYAQAGHKVLLVDDSGEGLGSSVQSSRPELDVLLTRKVGSDSRRSVVGPFFETIARSIRHAVEHYSFEVLMRLDCDAVMCNPGADESGARFFRVHPEVGMIGSYRTRCDGQARDFSWSAHILESECGTKLLPSHRALSASLNSVASAAISHGYEKGENVNAPGSMMSPSAAKALAANPLFGNSSFRPTRLGDDHLNSLFLRSMGFRLEDFATGDLPLAVWLRHIEWSPEDIVKRGKAVAHSVRGYRDLDEAQVRSRFRALREPA